jgi:hypothetical protein
MTLGEVILFEGRFREPRECFFSLSLFAKKSNDHVLPGWDPFAKPPGGQLPPPAKKRLFNLCVQRTFGGGQ